MRLYARPSWQLVRQLVADLFVLTGSLASWFAGRALDGTIRSLAQPARATEEAARSLQGSFDEAARAMDGVPWAGPALRQPFEAAASTLGGMVASASEQAARIEQVATLTGWLVFLIPCVMLLALWAPWRVRFVRNSRAVARFLGGRPDPDLLALRALANRPLHQLARISADPLADWRAGDRGVIDRLAELELRVRPRRGAGPYVAREGARRPDSPR